MQCEDHTPCEKGYKLLGRTTLPITLKSRQPTLSQEMKEGGITKKTIIM